MTDLQMGLIGLGGVAVVGVLAYNKWQEVKHRKLAEQLLNARQADVLLDETGSGGSGGESRTASAARDAGDASAAAAGRTTRAASERVEPLLQQPDDAPAVSEVDGSAGVDDTAAAAGAGGRAKR